MAEGYQALYRRYRSKRFGELRGQDHVVRALRTAVAEDRVGHAYLFSGPRGTGKTSTARILAKVLNCEHPVDGEPDGTCPNCVAVCGGWLRFAQFAQWRRSSWVAWRWRASLINSSTPSCRSTFPAAFAP